MNRLTDDIKYAYSDFDSYKLRWVYANPSTLSQRRLVIFVIAGLCAAVALMVASTVYLVAAIHAKWLLLGIVPGLIAVFLIRNWPRHNVAGSKREWNAYPTFHQPVSFWSSDQGLEMRTIYMDVLYRYDKVRVAAESQDVFSLVCGTSTVAIPKRALSDDQQRTIRDLLSAKVAGFVVIPPGPCP